MEIDNQQRNILKIVKIMFIAAAALEAAYLIFNRAGAASGSSSFGFSDMLQFLGLALMIAIAAVFDGREPGKRSRALEAILFGLAAVLFLEVIASMHTIIKIVLYYGTGVGISSGIFGNIDGLLEAFLVLTAVVAFMDKSRTLYQMSMITGFVTLACEAVFCISSVYSMITSATADTWNTLSTICYGPAWIIFEGAWIIFAAYKLKEQKIQGR